MKVKELVTEIMTRKETGEGLTISDLQGIDGAERLIKSHFGGYEEFYSSFRLDPDKYMSPLRRMNLVKSRSGLLFEELFGDLLDELGGDVIRQKRIEGLCPDFVIGNKIIDTKLSLPLAQSTAESKKYEDIADKVVLVYLIGEEKDYMATEKTRIVRYDKFYELLSLRGGDAGNYEKRFNYIKEIANSADDEKAVIRERGADIA